MKQYKTFLKWFRSMCTHACTVKQATAQGFGIHLIQFLYVYILQLNLYILNTQGRWKFVWVSEGSSYQGIFNTDQHQGKQQQSVWVMHQSIPAVNIPPGNPLGIHTSLVPGPSEIYPFVFGRGPGFSLGLIFRKNQ